MSLNLPQIVSAAPDVLNSWKEIASYLDRGVRTVQRWEAELAMPVRRPRGKSRSAVIAMRSELDLWLKGCPLCGGEPMTRVEIPVSTNGQFGSLKEVIARSQNLRAAVRLQCEEFDGALQRLMVSLDKLRRSRQASMVCVSATSQGANVSSHQRSHASSD